MKRFLVLCAALFTIIACNDSTGPGGVASIDVNFPTAPIPVGSTLQLVPEALDKNGNPVQAECVFTYTSSDQAVASVSNTGLITGVSSGTAIISVHTLGKSVSSTVTVGTGSSSVAAITLVPSLATIAQGQTGKIYAILTDANGNVIPHTNRLAPIPGRAARLPGVSAQSNAPVSIDWSSNNTGVATVNSSGLVTAVSQGIATITAIAGGKTNTATVLVVSSTNAVANVRIVPPAITIGVNSVAPLTAVVTDANGFGLSNRTFTWLSSNTTVATVDSATGLVRGIAPGTATVTVVSEGRTATATVTVSAAGQGSIAFEQASATVQVGGTSTVRVIVRDAAGNSVSNPNVAYTSQNAGVVTLVGFGVEATLTGVAAGNTTVRATSNGLTAELPVAVSSVAVSTVTITPASPQVAVNQTLQLTATARDGSNNILTGRPVTWQSSNENVAVISNTGLVLGKAVGTTTISATVGGVTNSVTLTVSPAQVTTIEFSPASPINLSIGQSVNVQVTLRDGSGNILTGHTVSYASRNVGIATVTSTNDLLFPPGRITGVTAGTTYVVASVTAGGSTKTDSVRVNVSTVTPTQLNIPTPLLCVPIGGALQLVGTVLDATNNVLTGRVVTWAVNNPLLGTINANGLLTGLVSGVVNVTGTVEGVVRTVAVTVCPVAVERVSLTPSTLSVTVGGTAQLTAVTYDGLDNPITGKTVTYQSSNTSVATVSNTGLVTGVGLGNATITATSEGKTATSTVTVTNAAVASVIATPSALSMTLTGGTRQLTVTTFDASGNVLTGRTVTYQSSNTAVATVSNTGVITPVGLGNTTITVTSEGRTTTVAVNVGNAPVETVEIVGPSLILKILFLSSSESYTVVTRDVNGNVLQGRACTLTSSNPNVFRIDLPNITSVGQIRVLGLGTATLTATCEGKTDTKDIAVVSALGL